MPPRRWSRYAYTQGALEADGTLQLSEYEPFRYVDLSDNRQYTVRAGDTYFHIAGQFFNGLPRPAGLWWVICDFQPQPVVDPTVPPAVGTVLIIPSVRTVQEQIFNETRRAETIG